MKKVRDVRENLIRAVANHPRDLVTTVAKQSRISRAAVHKHLRRLIDERVISATGKTKSRSYSLAPTKKVLKVFDLKGLEEHLVYRHFFGPELQGITPQAREIAHHGFTEMVNNAVDHSEGTKVTIEMVLTAAEVRFAILDNGIGIFRKISEALHVDDERYAILELAKGKFTTDPKKHSGEGIFFTSRAFDSFEIGSGNLFYSHFQSGDWLLESRAQLKGTIVAMSISAFSKKRMSDVFAAWEAEGSVGFTKTKIPVDLAQYGDENLVSRSQAKRVLARLERFREIIFDFEGVRSIGQAFADEIFRVFPSDQPSINIAVINANKLVTKMIQRVRKSGD